MAQDPVLQCHAIEQGLHREVVDADLRDDFAGEQAATEAWVSAELEMIKTPATSLAGVLIKLETLLEYLRGDLEEGKNIEDDFNAYTLLCAMNDLRRLAGKTV